MKWLYLLNVAALSLATVYAGDEEAPKKPPKIGHSAGGPTKIVVDASALSDALKKLSSATGAPKVMKKPSGASVITKKAPIIKTFEASLADYVRDDNSERIWNFLTSQPYEKSGADYPARTGSYSSEGNSEYKARSATKEELDLIIQAVKRVGATKDAHNRTTKQHVLFLDNYFDKMNGLYKSAVFQVGEDLPQTGQQLGKDSPYKEAYFKQLGYYFIIGRVSYDAGITESQRQNLINICKLSPERIDQFFERAKREKKADVPNITKKSTGTGDGPDTSAVDLNNVRSMLSGMNMANPQTIEFQKVQGTFNQSEKVFNEHYKAAQKRLEWLEKELQKIEAGNAVDKKEKIKKIKKAIKKAGKSFGDLEALNEQFVAKKEALANASKNLQEAKRIALETTQIIENAEAIKNSIEQISESFKPVPIVPPVKVGSAGGPPPPPEGGPPPMSGGIPKPPPSGGPPPPPPTAAKKAVDPRQALLDQIRKNKEKK